MDVLTIPEYFGLIARRVTICCLIIYISFIRSHVTYNSCTIWKGWKTNTKKCRGKNRLSEKKSKTQYKNLEAISTHCHVHKNISRCLRYGSSHGGAATPQPSLTVLTAKPGKEAAAPPRPHPPHTSKSANMTKKFLSVILSQFTYAIQPITDTKQFMNLGDPGVNFCIVSVKSWITAQVTMNTQISPVSPKSTSGIGRRPPSYILHGCSSLYLIAEKHASGVDDWS